MEKKLETNKNIKNRSIRAVPASLLKFIYRKFKT